MTLKDRVRNYWNNNTCETNKTHSPKYSLEYFEELERYRYDVTPDIFSFLQFTRWRGKKVLEIGTGAGTDFIQFARVGADIYGIDLTEESINHVNKRLEAYSLKGNVKVADAEDLPFDNETFDLVVSWGVLHHSPDTEKAISEAVRVTKSGGHIKLMLYNRHSIMALYVWGHAILMQKKIKSLKWALAHGIESEGTKAYTISEVKKIMNKLPVKILSIDTSVNKYDYLYKYPKIAQLMARCLINLFGHDKGFFMKIDLEKLC